MQLWSAAALIPGGDRESACSESTRERVWPRVVNLPLAGQVVSNAVKAVKHLRALGCVDIEFSPEDAGRSEPAFLYRVLSAVIEAGATTLNIPDTVCGSGLRVLKFGLVWLFFGQRLQPSMLPDIACELMNIQMMNMTHHLNFKLHVGARRGTLLSIFS